MVKALKENVVLYVLQYLQQRHQERIMKKLILMYSMYVICIIVVVGMMTVGYCEESYVDTLGTCKEYLDRLDRYKFGTETKADKERQQKQAAWLVGFHVGFSFVDINNQMEDIITDIGASTYRERVTEYCKKHKEMLWVRAEIEITRALYLEYKKTH